MTLLLWSTCRLLLTCSLAADVTVIPEDSKCLADATSPVILFLGTKSEMCLNRMRKQTNGGPVMCVMLHLETFH